MLNNHFKKWSRTVGCALFCCWLTGNALFAQDINEAWVKANYTKREEMIPMRDGAHLYTAIYEPIHSQKPSPILFTRTPYKAAPYGETMSNRLWRNWQKYAREKYIFVIQDVRGRWKSEGEFINVRPFVSEKEKNGKIDEASDVSVYYTHLRAHETDSYLVRRLLLEKKKKVKSEWHLTRVVSREREGSELSSE